jgi:hypothetical protein
MASIHKEITIDAHPGDVWDALRDWGAVHQRLVPGFVVDSQLDGDYRVVTFFNGAVARELLVDCDEQAKRLVWSVRESSLGLRHHNASAQVIAEGEGRTRFVWVADLLPHDLAPAVAGLIDRGLSTIAATLGRAAVRD